MERRSGARLASGGGLRLSGKSRLGILPASGGPLKFRRSTPGEGLNKSILEWSAHVESGEPSLARPAGCNSTACQACYFVSSSLFWRVNCRRYSAPSWTITANRPSPSNRRDDHRAGPTASSEGGRAWSVSSRELAADATKSIACPRVMRVIRVCISARAGSHCQVVLPRNPRRSPLPGSLCRPLKFGAFPPFLGAPGAAATIRACTNCRSPLFLRPHTP